MKAAIHGRGADRGRGDMVYADVLDAWFDPAPAAIAAFAESPAASLKTSPPVDGQPLIEAIAHARDVPEGAIVLGAGSSELIHRVLHTLAKTGPTLLLDPTYSEYRFACELRKIPVETVALAEPNFAIPTDRLATAGQQAACVVIVNPNNPTGRSISRAEVLELRERLPKSTALWVDEAYVDYADEDITAERDAVHIPGLFVLKSLSKAYALSGIRAAYLVCEPNQAERLRVATPPWIIGSSAMRAAIAALQSPEYYQRQYRETAKLRSELAHELSGLGLGVTIGHLNAVLIRLPEGCSAEATADLLANRGVLVRTPAGMGEILEDRYLRIAVRSREENRVVFAALKSVLE